MVLRQTVLKDKNTNSYIFGVETASYLRETHENRWGAKPSTFSDGSPRQEAASTPKVHEFVILSFGTIRRSTTLLVLDVFWSSVYDARLAAPWAEGPLNLVSILFKL